MSESTYKDDQELLLQHPHEQLTAIKRAFIEVWISSFPQTPPKPESRTTAHHRRGRQQWSRKSQGVMEEENPAPVRRSKRRISPPEYEQLPEPQKQKRTAAKPRGGGGKASQNFQRVLGSLPSETTLNALGTQSRTSSPTRNRNDLENAVPMIICREFPEIIAPDMREDVRSLRRELMPVVISRGILPQSLRDMLLPHLETWFQDDASFGEYPRSKKEETMIWMLIRDIRNNA